MVLKRRLIALIMGSASLFITACSQEDLNELNKPNLPNVEQSIGSLVSNTPFNWTIATWNVEHLTLPMSDGCRARTSEEITKLKEYSKSINADIIALQEVDSREAVAALFPNDGWQIVMSARPDSQSYDCRNSKATSTQQKVAFAVRRGIEILNTKNIDALALDNPGLRYGLELTVDSPLGALSLLNVHMKSGCFVDNYSREKSDACQTFAQQTPILTVWAQQKEKAGLPYMMLGDFNHRLSAPYNHLTRQLALNADDNKSSLENLSTDIIGCHPYYPALIDHVFAGNMPLKTLDKKITMHVFDNMKPKAMLSDHCALSIKFDPVNFTLSNGIQWHTQSKEYRLLTSTIYQRAEQALKNKTLPTSQWTVVMDVDETVLDNSPYQLSVEPTGVGYTPKTWDQWIASEKAILVPGAKAFIETVFKLGGKLALVTNRHRRQDAHTWRNLEAVGIEVSTTNTCLIGRDNADKKAINGKTIINDKDLRKQQLENGTASCYQPNDTRYSLFSGLEIVMQVGDNIQDFSKITQESASIDALLPLTNDEFILLPNATYGSWSE